MRKITFSLLVLALAATGMSAKSFKIDKDKTTVAWTGKKVTGKHYGTINVKSGTINRDGTKFSGEIIIDMTTIKVVDLTDPEYNAKLLGHLKSQDFFDVEKHPTATLKINSMKIKGSGKDYDVNADLTIKGITKPISFPATVDFSGNGVSAKAKLVIDRTKYDIKFRSGKFFENLGDNLIYDDFEIDVNVFAK